MKAADRRHSANQHTNIMVNPECAQNLRPMQKHRFFLQLTRGTFSKRCFIDLGGF
jgi:hypothetical protein